jgi:hypothetical protein
MRWRLYSSACIAVAVSAMALIDTANASSVSILSQSASPTASTATSSFMDPFIGFSGSFMPSVTGSVFNEALSPFVDQKLSYSVLSFDSAGPGSATYSTVGGSEFSFLWGSPDPYNVVTFYSGVDGSGSVVGSYTGNELSAATPDKGYDFVTFSISGVDSVVISNTGQAAFEYADVDPAPIPPTVLLFAGGLGLVGFFGWRKKRKQGEPEMLVAA